MFYKYINDDIQNKCKIVLMDRDSIDEKRDNLINRCEMEIIA